MSNKIKFSSFKSKKYQLDRNELHNYLNILVYFNHNVKKFSDSIESLQLTREKCNY